jgi:hypothetical protein
VRREWDGLQSSNKVPGFIPVGEIGNPLFTIRHSGLFLRIKPRYESFCFGDRLESCEGWFSYIRYGNYYRCAGNSRYGTVQI